MIAEFSLLLTCGMSLMWCLMPRAQVTSGFFRIQMLIAMGLSVLALLTVGQLTAQSGDAVRADRVLLARIASGCAVFFAYVGSMLWLLDKRRAGTATMMCVMAATVTSLVCALGGITLFASPSGILRFLSSLSTAGVLGGSVTGMLLGHWYLTAPTMSIDPLKTLSWYFAFAVVARLAMSLAGWLLGGQQIHGGVQWTWFVLRWLAGIIGPLAIAIMALKILRFRNTQAATGVLFAGVILTFIGEMSAALLYSDLHVPL